MRVFIAVLVLIFSFQSWTKAEDIRDFQIEGMSVGDSLLKFLSKEEINNSRRNYFSNERNYYVVGLTANLKTYEVVDVYLKTGDPNYIIKTIGGMIVFDDLEACLSLKKEIIKDLDIIFSNLKKGEFVRSHEFDKSKKSKQYQTVYDFGNGDRRDNHIRVECDTWSKEIKEKEGFTEGLNLIAMTTEILDWIYSDYK